MQNTNLTGVTDVKHHVKTHRRYGIKNKTTDFTNFKPTSNTVGSSELVITLGEYVIHLALSKTLDCFQYLLCTTLQRNEELCASGTEMNNSQRAFVRVKLCAFREINCVW